MQVHQFHPTVSFGDATSDQINSLRRMLRRMGYRSEIFCERMPVQFRGRVRLIDKYDRYSSPDHVLLVHFSLGYSPKVMDWLAQLPDRKVLVYHNITPHTFFEGVNDSYLQASMAGRKQLAQIARLVDAGWGDSSFNSRELSSNGLVQPEVLPIVFDPRRYAVRPDLKLMKCLQKRFNILFVGRVSPNKRIEDLILTFYYLKRFVRPDARLFLVGSVQGMDPYVEFLNALISRLALPDVVFAGHVSTAQLVTYYRCANIYLSMSEHEGFGVPLLESMHFGVPIVAYKAGAVPETLAGSGVLVTVKDYARTAELIGVLAQNTDLRDRIVARQRERLQCFMPEQAQKHFQELLTGL
ncbi:MAG: glycosyltransferase family 4 protein [Anaerolineae bacterium]|nr:glycosyltransferase family 4 protein [Anaerolineae bacterium]